jgi:hypothetical protein
MTRWVAVLALGLAACGYSHLGKPHSIFELQDQRLVLRVDRHVDTVISGPDFEEDQRLILELTDYQIGQRIPVPSRHVQARFTVERFGPASVGHDMTGFVVVKSLTNSQAVVQLHLDVQATTRSGGYRQLVKYRGDHVFTYRDRVLE